MYNSGEGYIPGRAVKAITPEVIDRASGAYRELADPNLYTSVRQEVSTAFRLLPAGSSPRCLDRHAPRLTVAQRGEGHSGHASGSCPRPPPKDPEEPHGATVPTQGRLKRLAAKGLSHDDPRAFLPCRRPASRAAGLPSASIQASTTRPALMWSCNSFSLTTSSTIREGFPPSRRPCRNASRGLVKHGSARTTRKPTPESRSGRESTRKVPGAVAPLDVVPANSLKIRVFRGLGGSVWRSYPLTS